MPERRAARTVARTSSRALLWADLRVRRLRRIGVASSSRDASRLISTTSSSVSCEKDVSCSRSSGEAIASTASRAGASPSPLASGPAEAIAGAGRGGADA